MKTHHLALLGLAPILLAACATTPGPEQQAKYAEEAKAAAGKLVKTLGGELKKAMGEGGPVDAISICKEKAPQIAAAISAETGSKLRRVSAKQRNPNSLPDAWEAKVLQDFEQRLARGAAADSLVYQEVVKDDGGLSFRFMKGLVVQEICMTCHGTKETIPDAVKAKLAAEYPNDQATGYQLNMLRGAVSVKRPL